MRRRAELAGELGEAAAAAELWRRYLAVETAPAARAEAELGCRRTSADNLGDVVGAIEQVKRVIVQRPSELPLRERLVGLATQAGDWPRVMRELREIARQRPGAAERARDELRLGRVARDHGRDPDEALAAFEQARELNPRTSTCCAIRSSWRPASGRRPAPTTSPAASPISAAPSTPPRTRSRSTIAWPRCSAGPATAMASGWPWSASRPWARRGPSSAR